MRIALIAVLVPLASCASSGLYNMSDDWCTAHLDASAARCPNNEEQRRIAVNDSQQAPNNQPALNTQLATNQ